MERSQEDVREEVPREGRQWTRAETISVVVVSGILGWYVVYLLVRWLIGAVGD